MNRLITNLATLSVGQPITDKTIPFIEDGIQEAISNMIIGLMGSYTTNDLIVLYGVVITISGNTATWTAGAIYYNGEVYTVPAGTVTKTGGQTFVFTNTVNYVNGIDPILFEDDNAHSVHQVRRIQIIAGTAGGSGVTNYIADYNGATVRNLTNLYNINIITAASTLLGAITAISINTDNIALKTKVVDITNWNMDTTATKSVAHSFSDITKIRTVNIIIRNDSGTIMSDINSWGITGQPEAGINYIDSTNVAITRLAGSTYDDSAYNGSGTRGYIIFKYIP